MGCNDELISFHVIERESNKTFHSWTYPTITEELKNYLILKCFTAEGYMCLRKNDQWIYVQHTKGDQKIAIAIVSKKFHPKKYKTLCDILGRKYTQCENPAELVQLYLNVFICGSCSIQENGTLLSCNFKSNATTNIKDFIKLYNRKVVLIYVALLLKRRTLVLSDNKDELFNVLHSLTSLAPFRNVNEYLQPLVEYPAELKGLSFFVAGTTNENLLHKEHLYDLFVNINNADLSVASHAEETFGITKIHKDMASFLVSLADTDATEYQIEQEILKKTNDILAQLKSLSSITINNDIKMITANDLKNLNYSPVLENFLFNLAVAENMMML